MSSRTPASPSALTRALAASGLAALLLGSGYAVVTALDDGDSTEAAERTVTEPATTTAPTPRAPATAPARLTAAGVLDPEGDGVENDDQAPLAVDGDAITSWATERYESFFKQGVGLLLDAGAQRRLQRLDVVTATPGYSAEIRVGPTASGPFTTAGKEREVGRLTQFALGGRRGRYVVVWITDLPDGSAAEVAEARLRVRRPG